MLPKGGSQKVHAPTQSATTLEQNEFRHHAKAIAFAKSSLWVMN